MTVHISIRVWNMMNHLVRTCHGRDFFLICEALRRGDSKGMYVEPHTGVVL